MTRLPSRIGAFLSGGVAVALILVLLMVFGVIPVKTTHTTVVEKTSYAAETSTPQTQTTGALTPAQIYQKYSAGVVEVLSTFNQSGGSSFFGPLSVPTQALGSGFVVSQDGYILTNAHVVSDNGQTASSVTVVFKVQGTQTKRVSAKIVGVDQTSDVAVLKVDPSKAPTLDPLVLGKSSQVQVGEAVVAIGNPLGYDFSLTSGIVSAVDRSLQSPNGSVISNGIQTDAAINEGNSGGPLIDGSGKVIGINEQIASQSGGNQGLGFAVPIDTAANVMSQLEKNGVVKYAWLGIEDETVSSDVAKALGLRNNSGVLVASVVSGSPAAKAGIKGGSTQKTLQGQTYVVGGDLITAIDGTQLSGMDQLTTIIGQHKPGDVITLTTVRGSTTHQVKVTLGTRPKVF
jgi:S1-C subfamily serine protease